MAQFEHGQEIFLHKNMQASSMACPDSAVDKVARRWSWPHTSIFCQGSM